MAALSKLVDAEAAALLPPPPLAHGDLWARFQVDALPEAWRAVVDTGCMRPALYPGDEVTLVRRAPRAGDVVCIALRDGLVWRRVLARDGEKLVVRADLAPLAEAWRGDVVGCVAGGGLPHRLAQAAPALWTSGVWQGALAMAHLRGARAWLSRRRRSAPALTTRLLGAADLPRLNELGRRELGVRTVRQRLEPGVHVVGAFSASGDLVGHYTLSRRGERADSAGLFVAPPWRGSGGGRLLACALAELAGQLGLVEVACTIHARNLASARAHRAAGFEREGPWQALSGQPELQRWVLRDVATRRATPSRG